MSTYAYPNPQAIFYQQYNMARRDEVVGILLALFLGDFGVHHFYLRRTGLGFSISASSGLAFQRFSGSLSASSCQAACASSTQFRRRQLPRRWGLQCQDGARR